MSHEEDTSLGALKERVKKVEDAIGTLGSIQTDVRLILYRLDQIEKQRPGSSNTCAQQQSKIDQLGKRLEAAELLISEAGKRIAAWGGGLAVLLVVVNIFGPTLRDMLTKP